MRRSPKDDDDGSGDDDGGKIDQRHRNEGVGSGVVDFVSKDDVEESK